MLLCQEPLTDARTAEEEAIHLTKKKSIAWPV
jgi:hypothetical protein